MIRSGKIAQGRLLPEDVYELRVEALRGMRHSVLARRLGVSQSTVTRAIHGDTHPQVPFPIEIDYGGSRPPGAPRHYSYAEALELLARTPDGEVEMVEHLGRRGIAGLLKFMDRLPGFDPELLRQQTAAEAQRVLLGSDHRAPPRP